MPRETLVIRILIVDDDPEMGETLVDGLVDRGFQAVAVTSGKEALSRLRQETFDVVVTDLRRPKVDGLSLVVQSRELLPGLPVIVMTAYGAVDSAVESIRQGASHYLTKPFKLDELVLFIERAVDERRVRREAAALRNVLSGKGPVAGIVAVSKGMREVMDLVERVANSDVPVLFLGETGTGKGLFARLLHTQGDRISGPFVTVNCAALPEPLLESELFGHVKGAFTGATRDRLGLVAESSGGTLFLDEIGEMSPGLQAKLLDVIERRVVRAVGSTKERVVDLRVVAATHRDLRQRIAAGAFREDLRFRLDLVSLDLPPLRARKEDLALLIDHFLGAARERHPTSPAERMSPEARAVLATYRWPGNVRELSHTVERMVILARSAELGIADLPPAIVTVKAEEGRSSRARCSPSASSRAATPRGRLNSWGANEAAPQSAWASTPRR